MKLLNIIDKLLTLVIRLGIATILSYISAIIFVPLAYAQRGYQAFGGEWIIIAGVFILSMYFTKKEDKQNGTYSKCEKGTALY